MGNPNVLIGSDYGPIIININDFGVGRGVSQVGYWSKDDIEIIKILINLILSKKESCVFYDVGANIGTHALALVKIFGEKIKIRAFEAQREVFNMLCGAVALNGLSNVYCHNVAIGDGRVRNMKIHLPDYSEINNFGGLELIPPVHSDNQRMKKNKIEDVGVATLDDFDEVVDFIKMDIEGMEDKAFAGAKQTLGRHRPICFFEISKTDIDFLLNLFRGIHYFGFRKGGDLIAIPSEHKLGLTGLERVF